MPSRDATGNVMTKGSHQNKTNIGRDVRSEEKENGKLIFTRMRDANKRHTKCQVCSRELHKYMIRYAAVALAELPQIGMQEIAYITPRWGKLFGSMKIKLVYGNFSSNHVSVDKRIAFGS